MAEPMTDERYAELCEFRKELPSVEEMEFDSSFTAVGAEIFHECMDEIARLRAEIASRDIPLGAPGADWAKLLEMERAGIAKKRR